MNPTDSNSKVNGLNVGSPPNATMPSMGDSALIHTQFPVPAPIVPVNGSGGGALVPARDYGPPLPPAMSGTPTMGGLMQSLRRRWPLALAVAVAATALAVLAVFMLMPGKYPAQVRMLVSSRGDVRVFSNEVSDQPEFLLYKANVAAMVRSQMILYAALNQKTSTGKDVKDLSLVSDLGVDWLESALKTDYVLGPEILKISLYTDQPEEGAELLNAVARALVEENSQKDNEHRDKRIRDFKENLGKLELELNKMRQQLRAREKVLNIPDEKMRQNQFNAAFQQQLKAAEAVTLNRTEQIKTREELASTRERFQKIDQMPITPERLDDMLRKDERSKTIFQDLNNVDNEILATKANGREGFIEDQLRALQQRKQTLKQRLAELKKQLQPEYEKSWRSKYADEVQQRVVTLQIQLTTLEKQEPLLKAELANTEEATRLSAPSSQVPLEIISLQGKIRDLEAATGDVSRTIQKMVAEVVTPRLSILQPATPAKSKDYSRQIKVAGAGGLGIFLMALFAVAFLEFRTRKVGAALDVSHGLGMNVVGTVPAMPAGARRQGSQQAGPDNLLWNHQLNEAIDGIRTMLLHSSRTENMRIIMVTSAAGGEGKTSLATQLAASLARAWRKTLLIDGDLRKPAAHKVFDLPQEPGFSELLRNEVTPADAIKPTSLGRLWLMPAGQFDSHAIQALAQDNMRTIFEQLKQQYDFIIVDSCPVLPVADALLLGQHVDGVVFTILRDVSRLPAVYAAQQKLSSLSIRTLGAVMIGDKAETGNMGYAYAGS